MDIAYSPCPNDTFLFDGWVHGKIQSTIKPEPILADIQKLNSWAYRGLYPVTKVSAYSLGKITSNYRMLRSGAAICKAGPKLIAKRPFCLSELGKKRVAIPGLDTTAYLLLQALCPEPQSVLATRYDAIGDLLKRDHCDAGLIIHETRFTFEEMGFCEVADLGELFSDRYGLPVPLGVIAAKRELPLSLHREIEHALQASLLFARQNPESSRPYVLSTSQEKDPSIAQKHIETYVTDETLEVSEQGLLAIKTLFELAIQKNLLPKEALHFL